MLYEELNEDNNVMSVLYASVAGTKLGRFQNKQVYMRNWSVGVVKINPGVTPKFQTNLCKHGKQATPLAKKCRGSKEKINHNHLQEESIQ